MTTLTPRGAAPVERLWRLEDPGGDFPFYNGTPVALSGKQWLFVMAAALAYVAPGHWHAIFGKVRGRELRLMLGFALLNIVVSMSVGFVVSTFVETTSNAANALLIGMDTAARIAFFTKTIPQLLGEELVTMLPFLALMYVLSNRFGVGRRSAIVAAWLISSLIFGLIHLPTYDWNLIQCVVIIGSARLILTLPWILTKNIWVSTGAHIINDWLLFSVNLLVAGLVVKP
jgi:uncharacterized protein